MKRTFTCVRKTLLALSITTISLIFATSCFMGGSGGNLEEDPIFPNDHTSTETKNVLVNIDFDNNNTHIYDLENAEITADTLFYKWKNPSRPSDALKDKHRKVCKLDGLKPSSISFDVRVTEQSALTFYFKSDMSVSNCLELSIYDKTHFKLKSAPIAHQGYGKGWVKVSYVLEPANYGISIKLPRQRQYSPDLKNLIYIDNITIAPNKVEYIEVYPKGLQETYVNGNSIKFEAVPLRGDRSKITGKQVSYSVSGCGNIDASGLFTPTSEGKCTVTASIDGKAVQKKDIYVHRKDYLLDSVKIGRYNFTGNQTIYNWNSWKQNTTNPQDIITDGFFVLEGYADIPLVITVTKNGTNYQTSYIIRDNKNFRKRIWLRFGKGTYYVSICSGKDKIGFYNTKDPKYEGDTYIVGGEPSVDVLPIKTVKVENTNNITDSEALYLLPSDLVQSDDFIISNMAHSILADLPANPSVADVYRSIHDCVLDKLYYDVVTLNDSSKRKRQDALHTYLYGTGVCEGYSNLYAALTRSLGLKSKVIGSKKLNHAWNNVEYKNEWYLVDVTADDPIPNKNDINYNDRNVGSENYTYFMTSLYDDYHNDPDSFSDNRSIGDIEVIPTVKGMPDGWY